MMVKTRIFPSNNYKALFFNGKTIRLAIDSSKPITELEYPEFYDVKITGKCEGNCPWCYMDSKKDDEHYDNCVEKIKEFFGKKMTPNQRPFQVAIGGGEPTSHPDFIHILRAFYDLDIQPNYTTNGMFINKKYSDKILQASKIYCGGVALSCHEHLDRYWEKAACYYLLHGIKLNFHLIISDNDSIDRFRGIYEIWKNRIDYFVLLPHTAKGRAKEIPIDWAYLLQILPDDTSKIAFGAGFYPYLLKGNHGIKVSLYEPECMSKFLDMKDMALYKSSFDLTRVN